MENLNTYIKEALVNHKVKSKYSYHPETKYELIECIQTELDKGNTDLNCIDTSDIADMSNLFDQHHGIKLTKEQQETLDVSEWDVSGVIDMCAIFFECKYFNCDLSNWDVSNVKDMRYMFENCEQINCDISNWDVSNVKDMNFMFSYCYQFNCDLSKWNVTIKNNDYLANMFYQSGLEGHEPAWFKNNII